MSSSVSESASFSSSQAIIAHFDEAAGVLAEGGFDISDHTWDSIARALREETIDEISFWGVVSDGTDGTDGKALLRIKVDWVAHAIVVEQGDQLILPMRDGSIHLYQVRRAAAAFLVAFERKGLRARIMLNYRSSERHREEELNRRYGWSTVPAIKQTGIGAGSEVSSRYHPGVSIGYFYSD